jgi:hypothetical protein
MGMAYRTGNPPFGGAPVGAHTLMYRQSSLSGCIGRPNREIVKFRAAPVPENCCIHAGFNLVAFNGSVHGFASTGFEKRSGGD